MLPNDLEAATLRRSPRLGSASLKRKRTEPSPGRTLKRSHLLASEESSSSPRSQRHRRRHPSVFDDEYPSPPPKKENPQTSRSSSVKGKERASATDDSSERVTRSRTRSRTTTTSDLDDSTKASPKKRKRASTAADQTCKKLKSVEPEHVLPYPMSLPNPIPTLLVTPPTPPNSPPLPEQQAWAWPAGTAPVLASETPSLDNAISSSSSQVYACPEKRIRRKRRTSPRVTDKSSDTLFKLTCRERVEHLKFYYLGQLQDYETDQAVAFFTRLQTTPSTSTSQGPTRPQSPTWNFTMHWQERLHDAGEWDGQPSGIRPPLHPVTPLALPPSMFTLPSSADQNWPESAEGELDFRTEDCYPFELVESDDEDEQHDEEQLPPSDPPSDDPNLNGSGNLEEESEDTESNESEESEDLSSAPPVQGESELQLAVYSPTPSSLAEALTPLVPSEAQQVPAIGIFALPVPLPPAPPKKQEIEIESPFPVRSVPKVEKKPPTPPPPPPPPLSLPPPPLATIFPGQNRVQDSDQLTETFQLEIIPEYTVAKMKALALTDSPPSFSSASPSVLLAQIRRQANTRLRTPYTRLLNYASKTLGSIARGTPMDPKRRRSVVAWLEDRKLAQHHDAGASTSPHDAEQIPPVGSAAWYSLRFPSLSSPQSSHPIVPTPSSPQTLLSAANHSNGGLQVDQGQSSYDTPDWPPLTVQPGDLETLRTQDWMEAKSFFEVGVGSTGTSQNVEFQQGSSQYPYPLQTNHGGSPSRFSPEIAAMDDADEDAEGDIDPDFVQPVSGFDQSIAPASSGSGSLAPDESQGRLMTTVAHGGDSYHPQNSTGISSLSGLPSNANGSIGFGSSQDFRREGIFGSNIISGSGSGFNAHDIGVHGHGVSNAEMPVSVPVPSRSFLDNSSTSFAELGIQGVGMNLNVGVSVGFGMGMGMGMGINRFGMDMMGIAFPALEPDWFLPGSPTHSSSLSGPGTSGEENEHTLGGFASPMYIDPLNDHARERFGSPGSPESAYPLGYAMG